MALVLSVFMMTTVIGCGSGTDWSSGKDAIKVNDEVLKNEYNSFKNSNKELLFKDYSTKKVIFINDMLKRIENND